MKADSKRINYYVTLYTNGYSYLLLMGHGNSFR